MGHIYYDSNYLMHYGVSGQKWGVITKEYVPTGRPPGPKKGLFHPVQSVRSRVRRMNEQSLAEERAEREAFQKGRAEVRERRQKIMRGVAYGGVALSGLLFAYGSFKYARALRAANRYSGSLRKLLARNVGGPLMFGATLASTYKMNERAEEEKNKRR